MVKMKHGTHGGISLVTASRALLGAHASEAWDAAQVEVTQDEESVATDAITCGATFVLET